VKMVKWHSLSKIIVTENDYGTNEINREVDSINRTVLHLGMFPGSGGGGHPQTP